MPFSASQSKSNSRWRHTNSRHKNDLKQVQSHKQAGRAVLLTSVHQRLRFFAAFAHWRLHASLRLQIADFRLQIGSAWRYGFTAEELDFISNYDIKYRLGRDSGDED